MDDKRQKNQKGLASKANGGSEASKSATRGSELTETAGEAERLAATEFMLEEVLDKDNLKEALSKVLENKGAAGIDGMTVDKLPAYLKENWRRIRNELLEGKYAPRAVRRVEIPKTTGGVRQLGIPTVASCYTDLRLRLG